MNNSALNIEEAHHHIFFHHNPKDSDGFITLCKKQKNGHFRQYHYRPDELAEHLSEWMGEDIFFSQQTFYKPQRSIENIRHLKSLYIDLDFYIFNYAPSWIIGKLEHEYFGQSIPEPNLIIFSGQGIVLIWLIEPVPYKALPLWQAVQNHFLSQLESLGGDPKAVDAARIFRLAGTVNSKNSKEVRVDYRHEYKHTLRDIQYEYLPELKPYVEKKNIPKKKGRKKKIVHLFNIYSLHHSRLLDIVKLVELRNGDVKSFREYLCFLYRYWSCCFTNNPKEALSQTVEFNKTFNNPLLKREVITATKSAEKAWEARSNDKANEIAVSKGFPGAGYNISNAKIIKWLKISPEEQEHMLTIIGTKEKQRRNTLYQKQKRIEQGIVPREIQNQMKIEAIKKAIEENPSASVRKISEITNLSKSAVQRFLKQM